MERIQQQESEHAQSQHAISGLLAGNGTATASKVPDLKNAVKPRHKTDKKVRDERVVPQPTCADK